MGEEALVAGAVTALLTTMRALFRRLPQGEWADGEHLATYAAGLPLPRFNGVVVTGPRADEGTAAAWLDELVFRGLPHAVLSRPTAPSWVAPLAAAYGLTSVEQEPFMVHGDPALLAGSSAAGSVDGLTLDVVDVTDAAQVRLAQQLMADGFGAPVDLLGTLMGPEALGGPGTVAYVGRLSGEPCTTGLGALVDRHVGVYNVATPPGFRRRGLGRAVTAHVVAEGVRAGARTAYLQASPMGFGVYERLGFRTVETWSCHYPD